MTAPDKVLVSWEGQVYLVLIFLNLLVYLKERVRKGKCKTSHDVTPKIIPMQTESHGIKDISSKQVKFDSSQLKQRESDLTSTDSEATTVLATQTQEITVSVNPTVNSGSDVLIQPSGFITNRRKRRRSSSARNRDRAKHMNDSKKNEDKANSKMYRVLYNLF